jgi:hypothetical protein
MHLGGQFLLYDDDRTITARFNITSTGRTHRGNWVELTCFHCYHKTTIVVRDYDIEIDLRALRAYAHWKNLKNLQMWYDHHDCPRIAETVEFPKPKKKKKKEEPVRLIRLD